MSKSPLALTVFLFSVLGITAPRADQPSCYTLESLEGSWTIISTFGANVARALGKRDIAADGSFTGTFLLNGPTAGVADGRTNDHDRSAERNVRSQLRRHRHHHTHRGGLERHHGESDR